MIDNYLSHIVTCLKKKGINITDNLLKMIYNGQNRELKIRMDQYSELLKKYNQRMKTEQESDDISPEIDMGNEIVKILSDITSHKYDENDNSLSISYYSFFMDIYYDENIDKTINSDIDNHEIYIN